MNQSTFARAAMLALAAILAAGCGAWLPFAPAPRPTGADDLPATFSPGTDGESLSGRWWEAFDSAELDGLMERGLAGNLDLARAWSRLRQAREQARIAGAGQAVSATGSASGQITQTQREVDLPGGGEKTDVETTHRYAFGINASYEIDLWGRIESETRAADLAAEATRFDLHATALTLSGQIARAWISLKQAHEEVDLIERQLETSRQTLDLLKMRQRRALSAAVDVLQQQQRVASLESSLAPVRERIQSLRLQLLLLLGKSPYAGLDLGDEPPPELPPLPAFGVPAHLLENRPDVQAAWRRLEAQDWNVAAAKAARLPSLSLTGGVDYGAPAFNDLFDNWSRNLAAGLTAPILDGGRRRAQQSLAEATADERFIAYRQTVLTALNEVEDAVVAERWQREYLDLLDAEFALAERTLEETERRYRAGQTDYLPVLTALASKQSLERSLIAARAALLTNRVALCTSLGADWTEPLTPSDIFLTLNDDSKETQTP